MIFVSAGTQFPFDRLIRIIDEWAPSTQEEIVVQCLQGEYKPKYIKLLAKISRDEFDAYVKRARLVVAHAGMGIIITSMLHSKPIVIFPRRASLGEHRNEHQLATAKKFEEMRYVVVAREESELIDKLASPNLPSLHTLQPNASPQLTQYIDDFIQRHIGKH